MEYPHHKYLSYLLSRRMTPYEVRAECVSRALMPPTDDAIADLATQLGPMPTFWRPQLLQTNVPFRRWLRDRGILMLWARDAATETALEFLHRAAVRKDFEAILLAHGDVRQAHRELCVKYPEGMVPSVGALLRYYEIFWDIGSMSPEGLFEHIEASQGKEDYLPAVQGDLTTTYARLGMEQRISRERLLQKVVDTGFAVADRIHREKDTIGGQQAAGLMVSVMGAMKAAEELAGLHISGEGDMSLRRDASDFMVRVVQNRVIPAIDEVDDLVLDAELVEVGAANVHRLPTRR